MKREAQLFFITFPLEHISKNTDVFALCVGSVCMLRKAIGAFDDVRSTKESEEKT